jgi:hypothetical protein
MILILRLYSLGLKLALILTKYLTRVRKCITAIWSSLPVKSSGIFLVNNCSFRSMRSYRLWVFGRFWSPPAGKLPSVAYRMIVLFACSRLFWAVPSKAVSSHTQYSKLLVRNSALVRQFLTSFSSLTLIGSLAKRARMACSICSYRIV